MKNKTKVDPIPPRMICEDFKKKQKHPDPKKHQVVSFIKSAIRLIGYGLIPVNLHLAAAVLVVSELVGILEELV